MLSIRIFRLKFARHWNITLLELDYTANSAPDITCLMRFGVYVGDILRRMSHERKLLPRTPL